MNVTEARAVIERALAGGAPAGPLADRPLAAHTFSRGAVLHSRLREGACREALLWGDPSQMPTSTVLELLARWPDAHPTGRRSPIGRRVGEGDVVLTVCADCAGEDSRAVIDYYDVLRTGEIYIHARVASVVRRVLDALDEHASHTGQQTRRGGGCRMTRLPQVVWADFGSVRAAVDATFTPPGRTAYAFFALDYLARAADERSEVLEDAQEQELAVAYRDLHRHYRTVLETALADIGQAWTRLWAHRAELAEGVGPDTAVEIGLPLPAHAGPVVSVLAVLEPAVGRDDPTWWRVVTRATSHLVLDTPVGWLRLGRQTCPVFAVDVDAASLAASTANAGQWPGWIVLGPCPGDAGAVPGGLGGLLEVTGRLYAEAGTAGPLHDPVAAFTAACGIVGVDQRRGSTRSAPFDVRALAAEVALRCPIPAQTVDVRTPKPARRRKLEPAAG